MRPAGRSLAEAYRSLGFISLYYDWNLDEARRAFEHALEISTGYVPAHMWLAAAHAADGKVDDAIAEANRAVTIEPSRLVPERISHGCFTSAGTLPKQRRSASCSVVWRKYDETLGSLSTQSDNPR